MISPSACDHKSKPARWERNDPAFIYRRRCSRCGAPGYVRHRRIIAYRCRFTGCKRDATELVWWQLRETRTCAEHRGEFEG